MYSSPVCCLADIPPIHFGYHAARYGKFAIGFHRASVVRHGFNPVLYTLPTTEVIRHIYEGLGSMDDVNTSDVEDAAQSLEAEIESDLMNYAEMVDDINAVFINDMTNEDAEVIGTPDVPDISSEIKVDTSNIVTAAEIMQ